MNKNFLIGSCVAAGALLLGIIILFAFNSKEPTEPTKPQNTQKSTSSAAQQNENKPDENKQPQAEVISVTNPEPLITGQAAKTNVKSNAPSVEVVASITGSSNADNKKAQVTDNNSEVLLNNTQNGSILTKPAAERVNEVATEKEVPSPDVATKIEPSTVPIAAANQKSSVEVDLTLSPSSSSETAIMIPPPTPEKSDEEKTKAEVPSTKNWAPWVPPPVFTSPPTAPDNLLRVIQSSLMEEEALNQSTSDSDDENVIVYVSRATKKSKKVRAANGEIVKVEFFTLSDDEDMKTISTEAENEGENPQVDTEVISESTEVFSCSSEATSYESCSGSSEATSSYEISSSSTEVLSDSSTTKKPKKTNKSKDYKKSKQRKSNMLEPKQNEPKKISEEEIVKMEEVEEEEIKEPEGNKVIRITNPKFRSLHF